MPDKDYAIDALRIRLTANKEKLAVERLGILQLCPARKYQNRANYGFAYIRAERLCIAAIKRRMGEIEWLPAKLDTSTEINATTRAQMTQWIRRGEDIAPGEEVFGNAFVHALTRCALTDSNHGEATENLADRIAVLFRDLTCLVAALHCCHLCTELGVARVKITDPKDISQIALDLTIVTETMLGMLEGEDEDEENPADNANADNQNKQSPPSYLRLVPDLPPEMPA